MEQCYTKTRSVYRKDDKIYYRLKVDNGLDIFTYNEELYQILKNTSLIPFRNKSKNGNNRLEFNYGSKKIKIYAYDLAYGCYHGYIKAETFLKDMKAFIEYKRGEDLTVDHLIDNRYNNTVYNLSLMTKKENASKNNIIGRVTSPNRLVCAYVGGEYRIELLTKGNGKAIPIIHDKLVALGWKPDYTQIEMTIRFLCNNTLELVDTIKHITTLNCEYTVPIRNNGKWITGKSYAQSLTECIKEQERVANYPTFFFNNEPIQNSATCF